MPINSEHLTGIVSVCPHKHYCPYILSLRGSITHSRAKSKRMGLPGLSISRSGHFSPPKRFTRIPVGNFVKKAEHRRIDAFEQWCWRRHLRVPWTARRSNQSILKEISPGCLLEGLILKLKLQYFGHLMRPHWKRP